MGWEDYLSALWPLAQPPKHALTIFLSQFFFFFFFLFLGQRQKQIFLPQKFLLVQFGKGSGLIPY